MGPGGLRGLQVALARDRVPILYYETPPDGSEGSFDSADMGSMIWIDKLSHGGFDDNVPGRISPCGTIVNREPR